MRQLQEILPDELNNALDDAWKERRAILERQSAIKAG